MKITDTVAAHRMLQPGHRVLCALSGGADSVCMTHALYRLRRQYGIEIAAAHFIHGLRPECAEAELALVQALCLQLGIPLFYQQGDTAAFAREKHLGTEEAARQLRYDFLHTMADRWQADRIATAHTMNDNAETVLFHLIRGSGTAGLCGIPPVAGKVIRPLLNTSRQEVEAYAAAHGLKYVTDDSNFDETFARNRIRHAVLPQLEQINPAAVSNIARAAGILREDAAFLEEQARQVLAGIPANESGAFAQAADLAELSTAVAARVVRYLAIAAGAREKDLSKRHIDAVLQLAAGADPSAAVDLPGDVRAWRSYDVLRIGPAEQTPEIPVQQLLLPEGSVRFGDWQICWETGGSEGWVLDGAQLQPPITVRARETGDSICVNGCTKSVKKLMIERKVPQNLRDITPVLCDNKGVLGVAGIACDSRRSANRQTKQRVGIVCTRINDLDTNSMQ